MTIRFLTSWNGYSAGDRATLSAAIETTLISGGIARADYVQDGASPLYPPNRNDAAAVVGRLLFCASLTATISTDGHRIRATTT